MAVDPMMMGVPPTGGAPEMEVDWDSFNEDDLLEDIYLSPEQEDRVSEFLHDEIFRSARFLRTIHEKIRKFREQYEEHRDEKRFPWRRASNVSVAITAPHVNQVVGRNIRVLKSTTPAIMVEPLPGVSMQIQNPELINGVQDFINAKIIQDESFFTRVYEMVLESTITGTAIGKIFWERKERDVKKYTYSVENSKLIPNIGNDTVTDYEGCRLDLVHCEDFFMPPESVHNPDAISDSHWIAQRFRERWGDVENKIRVGMYRREAAMALAEEQDQTSSEDNPFIEKAALREEGPVDPPQHMSANELILYEVWAKLKLDESEPECDVVIVYSYRHNAILSIKKNPFFHGKRPFVKLPYWPLADSFYGRGIPEQLRHTQHAANDVMNAGIDALTLANTGVWEATKGAGIKTGRNDRIWAGRILIVDEPNSIKRLDMGNPSPNTMQFIQQLDKVAQRASSVNDSLTGGESAQGNRETAEGMLARQGSSTPMFDVILDEIRKSVASVADLYLTTFQQFLPKGDYYLKIAENGQALQQHLSLPKESLVNKYRFRVVASTIAANPEIRKATLQHLMAVIGPLYGELIEAVKQMVDPSIPDAAVPIMVQAIRVRLTLARQLIHASELAGSVGLLPTFDELWKNMEQQIMQLREQAKKQPVQMEETIARKTGPDWTDMLPDEQLEWLKRGGWKALEREKSIAPKQPDQQAMGGSGTEGEGGMPSSPNQMHGFSTPPE